MKHQLADAFYGIPVPEDLTARVMGACREEAAHRIAQRHKGSLVRFVPAMATAAACLAVLAATLWMGKPPEPDSQLPVVAPGSSTAATDPTKTTTIPSRPEPTKITTTSKPEPTTSTNAPTKTTAIPSRPEPTKITTTSKPEPTMSTNAPTKSHTTFTTTESTTANIATHPTAVGGTPLKEIGLNKVSVFREMTITELEDYYGQTVIPVWLPKGMEQRLDMPLGVYKKDAALISENSSTWKNLLTSDIARDADVVYDCNQIRWTDFIDGRRELTVGICTAPYPRYKLGDITRFDDPIMVGNTEVMAAYFEDSADCWCWSALFRQANVEYYVAGWNITKEEFVHILESLVK